MSIQVFQIRQGDEHLSSHSGLGLVGALLARTSINKRVNPIPIVDTPPISNGDVVRAMIGLCCLGKPDFDAIEPMRKEPFFARALGLGQCPSSPTLRQRFDLVDGQFDSILKREYEDMQPPWDIVYHQEESSQRECGGLGETGQGRGKMPGDDVG